MRIVSTCIFLLGVIWSFSGFSQTLGAFTKVQLSPNVSLEMVAIPAGTFTMGSPETEKDRFYDKYGNEYEDEKQHTVMLTKPFLLGKYEVTQEQYEAVMGINPTKGKHHIGPRHPVTFVHWEDAREYCRRLNALYAGKLPEGYQFDLPTEAQWEYACRAGTKTAFNVGDMLNENDANFSLQKYNFFLHKYNNQTHEVGGYMPNDWGLYDMHGNVEEWCRDASLIYPQGVTAIDPTGSEPNALFRSIRGGSCMDRAGNCRSARRSRMTACLRSFTRGFRLALVPIIRDELAIVSSEMADDPNMPEGQPAAVPADVTIPAEWLKLDLGSNVILDLVKIPAGTFKMGTQVNDNNRYPDEYQHEVTLSKPFLLGKYEVTQEQYEAVIGTNPSHFKGAKRPVDSINWDDAKAFCDELNFHYAGKLPAGYQFALPTEAQWEYACRAGTSTAYNVGDSLNKRNANINVLLKKTSETCEVGHYQPNAWGLYDMHGNVEEWCSDWYGYFPEKTLTDPKGPLNGLHKVLRGGSHRDSSAECRSACRSFSPSNFGSQRSGFRLALVPVRLPQATPTGNQARTNSTAKVANGKPADGAESQVSVAPADGQIKALNNVLSLPNDVNLEMVKVEKGSFQRQDGKITLTQDFWIGKYEVTQEQWKAIMGDKVKPSNFNQPDGTDTTRHPMENISWTQAREFCQKLNSIKSIPRPAGYVFDLPTEAQWEYAARGGNKSRGYEYSGSNTCDDVAWYYENAGQRKLDDARFAVNRFKDNDNRHHPVGAKVANELGIHDMSGNVWEWCYDEYTSFTQNDKIDPKMDSDTSDSQRVRRGGGWFDTAKLCRLTYRILSMPTFRYNYLGFRVALVPAKR